MKFAIVLLLTALVPVFIVDKYMKTRSGIRAKFKAIQNYELPDLVMGELINNTLGWGQGLREEAIKGFKDYMCLFLVSNKKLAMPSVAIDEVWHAFLAHPILYREFCEKYIGRFIAHEPFNVKPTRLTFASKLDKEVLNTKRAIEDARAEGASIHTANNMPLIFAFDAHHGIQDGWNYDPIIYGMIETNTVGGSGSNSGYSTSDSTNSSLFSSSSHHSSSYHTSDSVGSSCSSSSHGSTCSSSSSGSSCSSGGGGCGGGGGD